MVWKKPVSILGDGRYVDLTDAPDDGRVAVTTFPTTSTTKAPTTLWPMGSGTLLPVTVSLPTMTTTSMPSLIATPIAFDAPDHEPDAGQWKV